MSADPVIDLLIHAGLRIAKPEAWTQGALARRANGAALSTPTAVSARSWDALGAVYAAAGINPAKPDTARREAQNAAYAAVVTLDRAAALLHKKTIVGVNDSMTHADVLEVFRTAIRRERAARAT